MEVRWCKPKTGFTKCNVSSSWINGSSLYGVAWILRDHCGNALLHNRDAFVATSSRMIAELKCILWVLEGLRDSHYQRAEVVSDNSMALMAVLQPQSWPRYQNLLDKIWQTRQSLKVCDIRTVKVSANAIARAIAKSVTRNERLQSDMALRGLAWLHNQMWIEARS